MRHHDPVSTIQLMASGYILPRCLHVVADLGVADALDETPRTAAELAASVGADPDALGRVLRLLAAHGVFAVRADGRTCHSPASRVLRDDHVQSMRAFARMFGLPINWVTYGSLRHAVETGETASGVAHPDGFWAYLTANPAEGQLFNAAMADKARHAVAAILAAYDFSRFTLIGDIGGGRGHLLQAVLDAVPAARGVLFDLPNVIADAASAGVGSERLRLQAGDFFHDVLPRCDAYVLMEIVHDWGGAESVSILKAVRASAPPGATVLVIETLVPDETGPDWSKVLDIHMLALLGGRQRTHTEYADLLAQAGLMLQRTIDTGAGIAILEASVA